MDRQKWVYAGVRAAGKKVLHAYRPMESTGVPGDKTTLLYSKCLYSCEVGSIIEVSYNTETFTVSLGGENRPKWCGMASDDTVAELRALDHAQRAELAVIREEARRKRMERKPQLRDVIAESLKPIMKAMGETDRLGRQAIQLMVHDHLSRWINDHY